MNLKLSNGIEMIMKKFFALFLTTLFMLCTGCGGKVQEESSVSIQPQEAQMRSICELATLQCYYHNVAKYNEKDASGALWWKKDRNFWIEYSGTVTIGIDVSKLKIEVDDEIINISLPPAEVQGCIVDENSLTEDSFIVAKDSADVNAEHQTAAFAEAQEKMKQAAESDTTLLENARQRAQQLLENYINNLGEYVGKGYEINWIYLDEDMPQADTDEVSETNIEE